MRARLHTHPCVDCGTPIECDGTLEANHDGWPEVICDLVHRFRQEPRCASCHDNRQDASSDDEAWSGGFAKNH